jgi:hypothetical protein
MVMGDPGRPRHAPYTSASSFRDFLERMRGLPVPDRVDKKYLAKLAVARNNEWALLSALKYLGIVDDRGVPTTAWVDLRGDGWRDSLRRLVEQAYRPLLESGGASLPADDLRTYFSVTSSTAQAHNAARFFRELRDLAGLGRSATPSLPPTVTATAPPRPAASAEGAQPAPPIPFPRTPPAAADKLQLALALARPEGHWTPEQQLALCDRILRILEHLNGPAHELSGD